MSLGRLLLTPIWFVLLLMFELILTILAYSYLAVYQREWFGYLARISSEFFNWLVNQLIALMPDVSNTAYATLMGELAPKAILLLMIGLIVGAIVRFVHWLIGGLFHG